MRQRPVLLCAVLGAFAIAGCAGSKPADEVDPLAKVRDAGARADTRAEAAEALWRESAADPAQRAAARENLKRLIWQAGQDPQLRVRLMGVLLEDDTPEGLADTRAMMRLMLPTEPRPTVVAYISEQAGARGWTEFAPALVRRYAQPVLEPPDDQRPERRALLALFPDRPLEQTVFEVFLEPGPDSPSSPREKVRAAAWELLGRLDPTGATRAELLATDPRAGADPTLQLLRRASVDFKTVPVTASQLLWLESMRDPAGGSSDRWSQTREAVAALRAEQLAGWSMRHLEPLRWAASNRPAWAAASRDELVATLASRLEGRRHYTRTESVTASAPQRGEGFRSWEPDLAWGDLLAILVIDEALRSPGMADELLEQARRDRRDTSTELGGVLELDPDGRFVATLYPPRPAARQGDTRFVASDDMMRRSGWSLAHYHFHAQTARHRDYAGPGPGDAEYADTHGRCCVVLTSVAEDVLNADYYQSKGAVVDLGELRR